MADREHMRYDPDMRIRDFLKGTPRRRQETTDARKIGSVFPSSEGHMSFRGYEGHEGQELRQKVEARRQKLEGKAETNPGPSTTGSGRSDPEDPDQILY